MENNKKSLEHIKNLLGGWLDSLNESNMALLEKVEELEKKVERLEGRIREMEENASREMQVPLRGGSETAGEGERDRVWPAEPPGKEMVPGIEWDSVPGEGAIAIGETAEEKEEEGVRTGVKGEEAEGGTWIGFEPAENDTEHTGDRTEEYKGEEENGEGPEEEYADPYEKGIKHKLQGVKKFFTGFRFKESFSGEEEDNGLKEEKEAETEAGTEIEEEAGEELREPAGLPESPGTDYRTPASGAAEEGRGGKRDELRDESIPVWPARAESFPVEYVPENEFPEIGDREAPEPEIAFQKEQAGEKAPKTVLDVIKPDWYDWEVDYPAPYIDDVFKGVSLNDRLVFVRELFGGDEAAFSTALEKINTLENFKAVTAYMRERYPQWDEQSDEVYRFYMVVRRKFNR